MQRSSVSLRSMIRSVIRITQRPIAAALLAPFICWAGVALGANKNAPLPGHMHGHGVLQVVVEGHQVLIEVEIPAEHLLGFEHAPHTVAEHDLVRKRLQALSAAKRWFRLSGPAVCSLSDYAIELGAMQATPAGLVRYDIAAAGDTSTNVASLRGGHSELHAVYTWSCKYPEELSELNVTLFETLTGIEELDVTLVTPRSQRQIELTPNATEIDLRAR